MRVCVCVCAIGVCVCVCVGAFAFETVRGFKEKHQIHVRSFQLHFTMYIYCLLDTSVHKLAKLGREFQVYNAAK